MKQLTFNRKDGFSHTNYYNPNSWQDIELYERDYKNWLESQGYKKK